MPRHCTGRRLNRAVPCCAVPCRAGDFLEAGSRMGLCRRAQGWRRQLRGCRSHGRTRAAGMLFHVPFSRDVPSAAPAYSTLRPNPPARPPARGGGCVFSLLQASRGLPTTSPPARLPFTLAVPAGVLSPLHVDIQAPALGASTTACAFHREYLYHFA